MKYLYPYECEKRGLSNPNELQAAIDSNRREGRRQSFGGSLFAYSPGGAHGMLSSPKLPVPALGLAASTNGSSIAPAPKIKKGRDGHRAWGHPRPSFSLAGQPFPSLGNQTIPPRWAWKSSPALPEADITT